MTRKRLLGVLAGLCLCASVGADLTGPSGGPDVSAGTEVRVRLKQTLKSGRDKKGDAVRFEVAADVRAADGTVLIPAGTPATGVVEQSSRAGRFGRGGRLRLTCDAVHPAQGAPIPLRALAPLTRTAGSAVGLLAGGLAGAATAVVLNQPTEPLFYLGPKPPPSSSRVPGTLIGAGVGLLVYAMVRGPEVTAKEGSEFVLQVTGRTTAPAPTPAPATGER